ncbi:MAG: serine/threonine protein kinase [Acidobacteria bacterium]|nr:serine/threonine protein kinase [Acidobacteriota bacterium]
MLERIGKYEILRPLGQGAMGEVHLGRDPQIGREVAIKTISAANAQGDEARGRFLREARAAGTLSHPNLVTVHEFGEDQGLLYLVMEFVPGDDLHSLLNRKLLPPREVLDILAQVLDGLAFAHGRGVLHRDIKPSNIRVARPNGRPLAKVMDFGIARISGSDFTGTGTLLGTFGYMAPEYIQTGRPDARSDLFAVGVILYEALTGVRPFLGDTTATVLYRIVHEQPPPLDPAVLTGVSPSVGAIVCRALAKDPEARFQSAGEMALALRAAMDPTWRGLDGEATVAVARPAGTLVQNEASPTGAALPRRGPWIAAAAGLLLLVGGGLLFWPRPGAAGPATLPASAPSPVPAPPPAPPAPQDPAPGPQDRLPPQVASTSSVDRPPPAASKAVSAPGIPRPAQAAPKPPPIATLDEAGQAVDRDPRAVLAFLDRFLREDPRNPRAHALRVVAFYELGDFEGMKESLKTLPASGVPPRALLAFPRYRAMLKQELENPKLPAEMHERMVEALRREGLRRRGPFKGSGS